MIAFIVKKGLIMNKSPDDEFLLVRDKLKKIATLLVEGNPASTIEAAFLVGCLHNICHQNSILFTPDCNADLHE